MKAWLIGILLIIAFFFEPIVNLVLGNIHQTVFFKTTSELSDILKAEGGVNNHVTNIIAQLEARGYSIEIKDTSNNVVTSIVEPGTQLTVFYDYKFKDASGEKTISTTNNVLVLKR